MITPDLQSRCIGYAEARELLMRHPIRSSEIPIETYISLPMPTLRWRQPAWASFAAPAVRRTDRYRVGLPDRWWAIDARTGRLAAYARTNVVPLMADETRPVSPADGLIDMKPEKRSVDQQRKDLSRLSEALDLITTEFFDGRNANASNRHEVKAAIHAAVPEALLPFYRGLAPDFFKWIEAA